MLEDKKRDAEVLTMKLPSLGVLILMLLKPVSMLDPSSLFGPRDYPGCNSIARCLLFVLTFNLVTMTVNGNYRTCDKGTIEPREPYYLVGQDIELVCNANHEVKGILTFWNQTQYVDPQLMSKINSTAIKLLVPNNTVSKMYSLMCVVTDSLDADYSSCINNIYLEFEYPVQASDLTLRIYDWEEMWLNWTFKAINEENINVTCKYVGSYSEDINMTVFYSGDGSESWAICPDQDERECYWDPAHYNGESIYLFQVLTTNTRINVTNITKAVFNETDQYVEPATIKELKVLDGNKSGCVDLSWKVPRRRGLNYTFNITYMSDCESSSVRMIQAHFIYRYRFLQINGREMNLTICDLDPSVLYTFNIVGGVNISSKPIRYWSKPLDPPVPHKTKLEIPKEVDVNVTQDTEAGGVMLSWDMACEAGGSGNVQNYILKYCTARMDSCKCFSDWSVKVISNKTGSILVQDDDWYDGMYICLDFGAENELGKGAVRRLGPIKIKDYDTTRTLTPVNIALIVVSVLIIFGIGFMIYRCRRQFKSFLQPPEISDKLMNEVLQNVKTSENDPLLKDTSEGINLSEKPSMKSSMSDADSGASSLETVSTLRTQGRDADGSTDSAIGSHNSAHNSQIVIEGGPLSITTDTAHNEKNVECPDEKLVKRWTKSNVDSDNIVGYETANNISDDLSSEDETFADNETETENLLSSANSLERVSSTHFFPSREDTCISQREINESGSSPNLTSGPKESFAAIGCNDPSVINMSLTDFDFPNTSPGENDSAPEVETSLIKIDEDIDGSCYEYDDYDSENDTDLSKKGYSSVYCNYDEEKEEELEVNSELLESHNDSFNNSGSLSSTDQYVKASMDQLPQDGADMGKDEGIAEGAVDIVTKIGSKSDAAVISEQV